MKETRQLIKIQRLEKSCELIYMYLSKKSKNEAMSN